MKNHDWRLQLPFSGPEDANSRNHSGNMSVVAAITIQLEPIQRVLFQREIVSPGPHSNCVCQPSLHKPCKVKVSCKLLLSLLGNFLTFRSFAIMITCKAGPRRSPRSSRDSSHALSSPSADSATTTPRPG